MKNKKKTKNLALQCCSIYPNVFIIIAAHVETYNMLLNHSKHKWHMPAECVCVWEREREIAGEQKRKDYWLMG